MFIIPGAKLAHSIDLSTILSNAVTSECGTNAAFTIQPAAKVIDDLRKILSEPPDTERTRQQIGTYLATLHYLNLVRPSIINNLAHPIHWVNAFDANSVMTSTNLILDRVSALFNLGVCAARIARSYYQRRRHDPNALKSAAHNFKLAAGYFRAARDEPLPDGIRSATPDLFPASLDALELAMLGNAQQIHFMFAQAGGTGPVILARFAAGARDYYASAVEFCNENDIKTTPVYENIGLPCAALSAYYDIIVHETMAEADKKIGEHANSLTRYDYAEQAGNRAATVLQGWSQTALAEVNNLRVFFEDELTKKRVQVGEKKKDLETLNRTTLFLSKAEYVPPVQTHQALQPVDVGPGFGDGVADERLRAFADLPEPSLQESRQTDLPNKYTEMATSHVSDKVAHMSAAATTLRERIAQIEADLEQTEAMVNSEVKAKEALPASSLEEEQKAVDAILYVQGQGGLSALRTKQETITGIAGSAKSQIQSIELLLQQEEAEDRELRSRIYVQRPVSQVRSQEYHTNIAKIKGNLVKAANADMILERDINSHAAAFRDLLEINLHGFVPPSAKTAMSEANRLQAEYLGLVKNANPQITRSKEQLEEIKLLIQKFQNKQTEDDPAAVTKSVKPGDGEVDELADLLSRQYIGLDTKAEFAKEQVQILSSSLMELGKKLRQLRPTTNTGNGDQQMMNVVYRNQAAAEKFREIMNHFEKGEDFYRKEKETIDNLRNDVDGFVAARRTEARDLENLAQRAQGGSYPPTMNQSQPNNYYYHQGGNAHPPGSQPPPAGGNTSGGNNYYRYH